MNKVLSVISKLAPVIGTVLGGPLAGTAISAIEGALGVKTSGATQVEKENELAAAISGATPAQLLALKTADNDFAVKMAELGFHDTESLAALQVEDRKSAREREVSVKDNTPRVLAYILCAGALGVAYWLLVYGAKIDSTLGGMVMMHVFSEAKAATGYYFGASPSVDPKISTSK